MIKFAFYGRVSTEDQQDLESSRAWQLTRSRALIEPRDGQILAEFFDVDRSRSIPWQRRPRATALLAELKNPDRGFDAVVIGEPHRAFYGNQYGLTFPIFEHYAVPLWVPEVGGLIDPANEAHDLVMSVFGGMSKGERNRIKIRVRTAMAAQAKDEGRFLGGRPPYGYLIADAGPHPNPAKAADGKRLHKLDLDPDAAPVVRRIFAEFIAGHGFYAIAEGLTRDGIPSPSAHDPGRNRHRCGIAWNKFAVRVILINPRYTGHQVWSKQRKDEVLIDVDDVALGHTTKLRWNETDDWIWSEKIVHPPIIDRASFEQVQMLVSGRASMPARHKPHRAQHPYALRGCVWCGICERRMQSHWANAAPYYRCRFPAEYAVANQVEHPLSVSLREDAIIGQVDGWLALEFAPHRLAETIRDLAAAQQTDRARNASSDEETKRKIADCDAKLAQYRAALDAGASPVTVAAWIAEIEAKRATYTLGMRRTEPRPRRMTEAEIRAIVDKLADIAGVLRDAEPDDKAEIFRQLGLKLTYYPGRRSVQATVEPVQYGFFDSVRGPSAPKRQCHRSTGFALGRYAAPPEIKLRVDALVAGQRDAGSTRTSTRKTFALMWVIKVVVQLTIAAWLALEAGLLIRDRVRGKGSTARDQGTLWLNIIIITAAVVAAGILTGGLKNAAWQFGSTGLIVAGLLVMWTGLVVRIWAIAVLGRSFRTTVEVDTGQKVVDSGPYRWVRHPSYTGILLLMVGLSLVYGNWLALAILLVLPTGVLIHRIFVEEAVLTEVIGRAYTEYAARTKRLVPGLW